MQLLNPDKQYRNLTTMEKREKGKLIKIMFFNGSMTLSYLTKKYKCSHKCQKERISEGLDGGLVFTIH